MKRFCIVGAGLSGAVLARELADHGLSSLVVDERSHVAGNCHTTKDESTGIMVHRYGPHIFHTAEEDVWEYVSRHCTMMPYINRVKAQVRNRIYSLPINLLTINQFFGASMRPDEARLFIAGLADSSISTPVTFEDQALSMIGRDLYEAFFRGYTRKQWGIEPSELPAAVLKRLPIRFNYDDNYFSHPYQGIPREGYTGMVENILDHPCIELRLGTSFEQLGDDFSHVFYTGPIDRYFNYSLGRLAYRTLDFEQFESDGDYQGVAVMNYCDEDVPYTRITEHKFFAPWEVPMINRSLCFREYSRQAGIGDTPYYPVRQAREVSMLKGYIEMARMCRGVSFLGRLGTYRYLDMDVSIKEALISARSVLMSLARGEVLKSFFVSDESLAA